MDKVSIKVQIFFEDPFWIGVCERVIEGGLSVCKITFGPEPKEYEFEEFVLKNWYHLKFSQATQVTEKQNEYTNPKRIQREVRRQVQNVGIGTKSQQALKLQYEETKLERKMISRKRKEEEEERQFLLKQLKRKEKHKGR